ncbi:MAG: cation-transporting P-type ATPase [Campylobacterota bacterium]
MKTLRRSEILSVLETGEEGLSEAEAAIRLAEYGPNLLPRIKPRSAVRKLLDQFTHFFALLLWTAAGISFLSAALDPSSGIEAIGWAILAVIVLNGLGGFYQEYRTERSLEALRNILPQRVNVRREGKRRTIPSEQLVIGDVVLVGEGDKVPADLYILSAFDVWVNESTLTGESVPVSADAVETGHPRHTLYSGTFVIKGEAMGVVYAVGKETRYGKIAMMTQEVDSGIGHLQKEISHISKVIAAVSFAIAGSFIVIAGMEGFELWKSFLFALGVLVAMIPEGLLPTVTLALAFAAQRMASKGFLVNTLSVIENLGAVTVIATDKTGTITRNTMEVVASAEPPSEEMLEVIVLCNRADGDRGDPVDLALLRYAEGYGDIGERRSAKPLLVEYPFDYHLKRMGTLHQTASGFDVFVKGAPEIIIALCDTDIRGTALDGVLKERLSAEHDGLASLGYRVIALARKYSPIRPLSREEAERGLSFIAFIPLIDPLREDITEAVAKCRRAGIRLLMITGDHPITAGSIGVQAGIVDSAQDVLSAEQIESIPPEGLKRLLKKNRVFARVSPEQKLRIVTLLKEMGETVAVTGDGVNDAPALKKADVGIAMGSGTDVAKQSADAVLVDDHFATIVKGIEEGRAVYENIRRFITYMLASNLPEAVPYILYFWMGVPLALPVALVLAIDLGTDIMPGLALGAEPPHKTLMRKGPRSRKEPILTPGVYLRAFGFLGVLGSAVSMGFFFGYLYAHGWEWGEHLAWNDPLYLQATTLTFAAIVFAQIGNGLSCRSERDSLLSVGWRSNPYYWGGVASELVILGAIVWMPGISGVFATAPFEPAYWIAVAMIVPLVVAAEEVRKAVVRYRG